METLDWNDAWSAKSYEWPVTPIPDSDVIEQLGDPGGFRLGGLKEAHADRGITMDFPNKVVPGTRLRKQIIRAECNRRAQININLGLGDSPLKVCVVCDAVNLWPRAETVLG